MSTYNISPEDIFTFMEKINTVNNTNNDINNNINNDNKNNFYTQINEQISSEYVINDVIIKKLASNTILQKQLDSYLKNINILEKDKHINDMPLEYINKLTIENKNTFKNIILSKINDINTNSINTNNIKEYSDNFNKLEINNKSNKSTKINTNVEIIVNKRELSRSAKKNKMLINDNNLIDQEEIINEMGVD